MLSNRVFHRVIGVLLMALLLRVAWAQESMPGSPAPADSAMGAPAGPGGDAQSGASATDPAVSVLSGFMEPFEYDPQGRKDPFAQPAIEKPLPPGAFHGPVLPLQKFKLEQLSLIGVIWDVSRPRAMFKDPSGKVHVVGPNAKLGDMNGYVAAIREGEVVVIETREEDGKLFSSARVVKIAGGDQAATR